MPAVALIGLALSLVEKLIPYIAAMRKNLAQTGEWTPEERAAIDARWETLKKSDAWTTDAERAGG